MAGVKGRSGGARPNSGGARPGAGRPKKAPQILDLETVSLTHRDPKTFLFAVMNDAESDVKVRLEAAKVLMPYLHVKKGEIGKKVEREQQSEVAERGTDWAGLLQSALPQ